MSYDLFLYHRECEELGEERVIDRSSLEKILGSYGKLAKDGFDYIYQCDDIEIDVLTGNDPIELVNISLPYSTPRPEQAHREAVSLALRLAHRMGLRMQNPQTGESFDPGAAPFDHQRERKIWEEAVACAQWFFGDCRPCNAVK